MMSHIKDVHSVRFYQMYQDEKSEGPIDGKSFLNLSAIELNAML